MNPKRLGFQTVDIHFGTFDFTTHVVVGPFVNLEQYARWKLEDPNITPSPAARGLHICRYGYVPIIWLPRKPRTPREMGTLAHELLHTIRVMLVDWVGINLNQDTDEAFCHALGMAVTKTLEGLK